ncbi:MAG: hypothetical protein BYD32DRAFT_415627 [Podila humilis]|nr:MAG: hypothetical protein BYD32DRAFT_415627 [Podila humilis]
MRKQQEREREVMKTSAGRPTSMIHSRKNSYHSVPINLPLSTVSESSTIQEDSGSEPGTQAASPREIALGQDGERIISNQEQLVTPLDGESSPKVVEAQRSPLSGVILVPLPHDLQPPKLPPSMLAEALSNSRSASGSRTTPGSRSNSVSAQPPGPTLSTPLSSKASPFYVSLPLPPYSQQTTHPLWSPPSAFPAEKSEFPMRSLPPPKRHADHGFSSRNFVFPGPDKGVTRKEMPRRSSAAAAVTLGSGGDVKSSSLAGRPSYFARRQSSSPVLIRVNGHGGQDISPLLNSEGSKIFSGSTPEVRRPGISPLSSSASSSLSGSVSNTSICSFVTSKYVGDDPKYLGSPLSSHEEVQLVVEGSPLLALDQARTPTGPASPMAQRASPSSHVGMETRSPSPLAAASPMQATPSGSPTTTSAPLGAPEGTTESSSKEYRFPASAPLTIAPSTDSPDGNQEIPSVVVNSGTLLKQDTQRIVIPQKVFQFPAPSSHSEDADPSSDQHEDERRFSVCSSGTMSGSSLRGDRSEASSRSGSPVASPSFHASAMELYPGLRKLSLFTAAIGGHPPPPLLSGRKGSAGSSSSRDYHHSHHHRLSTMHDGDENDCYSGTGTEGEGEESDEDWAGNMKSRGPLYDLQEFRRPSVFLQQQRPAPQSPAAIAMANIQSRLQGPPPGPLPAPPPSQTLLPLPPSTASSPTQTPTPSGPPPSLDSVVAQVIPPLPPSPSVTPTPTSVRRPVTPSSMPSSQFPPAIPPRSPHRSVPTSPVSLRSARSFQNLPPVPVLPVLPETVATEAPEPPRGL